MFLQMVNVVWYLGLLYFGTMFNIAYFTNIAGTFCVFLGLDWQRIILKIFPNSSWTIWSGLVVVNLYAVRYYIQNYPDYFIF